MQKYLDKPQLKYYHILVGHETKHIIHPELFCARRAVEKDGQQVMTKDNYPKTYEIASLDLTDTTVTSWTSKNSHYGPLTGQEKGAINAVKKFINNQPEWKNMVVFHDTECRIDNKYSYGNHLHIVVATKITQLSKHAAYRSMQQQIIKLGGTCRMGHIKEWVESFVKYLAKDTEKQFLGANGDELREMYKECEAMTGQMEQWKIEDEDSVAPKRAAAFEYELENDAQTEERQVPKHLNDKAKSADTVQYIINLLKDNKDAVTIQHLLRKYPINSETGKALCHIALSQGGNKAFELAQNYLTELDTLKTPEELILELPDEITDYMTPRQSQAMFNSWAKYQNINRRKYTAIMQYLLGGRGKKRIGVFMHGRPDSGKTVFSNTIWGPVNTIVGRVTREPLFLFQDCPKKRILVAEEMAITIANIENYKSALSGATLQCSIKNKTPENCTPYMVMMNSNTTYRYHLDGDKIEAIEVRIFNYENLKPFKLLKKMTGNMHPKLFYDNVSPLSQEEEIRIRTGEGEWTDEPIGYGEEFTGNWEEIPRMSNVPAAPESPMYEPVTPDYTANDSQEHRLDKQDQIYWDNNDDIAQKTRQEIHPESQTEMEPDTDEYRHLRPAARAAATSPKTTVIYKTEEDGFKWWYLATDTDIGRECRYIRQKNAAMEDEENSMQTQSGTDPDTTIDPEKAKTWYDARKDAEWQAFTTKHARETEERKHAERAEQNEGMAPQELDVWEDREDDGENKENIPPSGSIIKRRRLEQAREDRAWKPERAPEEFKDITADCDPDEIDVRPFHRLIKHYRDNDRHTRFLSDGRVLVYCARLRDEYEESQLEERLETDYCGHDDSDDKVVLPDIVNPDQIVTYTLQKNPFTKKQDIRASLDNMYEQLNYYSFSALLTATASKPGRRQGDLPYSYEVTFQDEHKYRTRPIYDSKQGVEWLPRDTIWNYRGPVQGVVDPLDPDPVNSYFYDAHFDKTDTEDSSTITLIDTDGTIITRLRMPTVYWTHGRLIKDISIHSQDERDITNKKPDTVPIRLTDKETDDDYCAFKCMTYAQMYRLDKKETEYERYRLNHDTWRALSKMWEKIRMNQTDYSPNAKDATSNLYNMIYAFA